MTGQKNGKIQIWISDEFFYMNVCVSIFFLLIKRRTDDNWTWTYVCVCVYRVNSTLDTKFGR